MTRKEISGYRQELHNILQKEKEDQRIEELKTLAKKVAAGYVNTQIAAVTSDPPHGSLGSVKHIHQNPISESELVQNINNALQTETMIDVCKTAARNYWITVAAAVAAALSALAAWLAIVNSCGAAGS